MGPIKYHSEMKNQSLSGTFSPDTITTTSSGYSTGSSTNNYPPQKIKSKSIQSLISKLKRWITTPKSKLVRSTTTTKDMPSTTTTTTTTTTNILRQYSTSYDLSSSTNANSKTISLPFTYYHNSTSEIPQIKTHNFDQISAWLDRGDLLIEEDDEIDLLFIDESNEQSNSSTSSIEIDYQMLMMKKTSVNNRTPRRSSSLVSTISRPIIESKQYDKSISPTSSFSSSILIRGMSENLTPQKSYHLSRVNLNDESMNHHQQQQQSSSKSNRRRAIDFNRRRTVAGPTESVNQTTNNNKENLPHTRRQQVYRFSPSTNNNQQGKKYFFHSNPNEDMLMNSYGLTLLQPRRQSVTANITLLPSTEANSSRRTSIQLTPSDPLDDLLCDREVESYFYPNRRTSPPSSSSSQHVYINLEPTPNYYQSTTSVPYFHGTLC